MTVTVVSWNIAKRQEPWRQLLQIDADVALLQEAVSPPSDVAGSVDAGPSEHWDSHVWNSRWFGDRFSKLFDRWPMVVKLSDRVEVDWFKQVSPIGWTERDEIAVSGIGTIAAARITPSDSSAGPFVAVSMYGRWIGPHPSVNTAWRFGYADSSVHRIISDLSAFIGHENPQTHRILAAGDLNVAHGYGDSGDPYWEARYRSVFERMTTIGLEFMGPQAPNGRQAETPATGEPADSLNVVTYYLPGKNPETATNNQIDYVFASRGFHEDITVLAMNSVAEWGASDHCRLLIKVADGHNPALDS